MSLNDTEKSLILFQKALEEFSESVRVSITEIEASHERARPLWEDSMQREYQQKWAPLHGQIKDYNNTLGKKYQETIQVRLHFLRRYLYGS